MTIKCFAYATLYAACVASLLGGCTAASHAEADNPQPVDTWTIDTQQQWIDSIAQHKGLVIEAGLAQPADQSAAFTSTLKRFDQKRKATSVTFEQCPRWLNWQAVENLGPVNMQDAPVFLSLGPNNYWTFGRYGGAKQRPAHFQAKPATLPGFEDTPLLTSPYPNQYDAPGGLQPPLGGYHAWQSRDMKNWVHHGPVTPAFAKWVTSAEYHDGKLYIFYDFPNDQDPHVFEDDNLFDGKPGKNLGLAFNDPSDGSDAAFIRDRDGNFRVFYEDWTPINARKHSWDSPLAGHAVSKTPAGGYAILPPAIDHRTTDTGRDGTYNHPHWVKEDPQRFKSNVATYDIHEPTQNAYGDWAVIAIGSRYYLFGDDHPANQKQLRVGWFTTDDLTKPFEKCGHIGKGHPDPDIGFAEGQFYLFTQQATDYVSPGPWVPGVTARLGVDTNNDGNIDQWTEWQKVQETYDYAKGFAKQIDKTPAQLDASDLPAGFGFAFEVKLQDTTENQSKPALDRVTLRFR